MKKFFFLAFSLCLLSSSTVFAQKSSKSKSSDKLYERIPKKPVRIRNVKSINSGNIEFSPQFYQNGLVYVKSASSKENNYELYYSEFNESGVPGIPERFDVLVSKNKHEGPVSFSRDLKTLYYSTNSTSEDTDSNNDGRNDHTVKIYEASRSANDWTNVRELPFNSENYYCFHPSLSPDGKKLYFTSNMPGGYGGSDLYVVEKYGNNWGEPKNLGPNINTRDNEAFPYIHESGNLIFSSKGHNAVGGYDIYISNVSSGLNNSIVNLGPPFSTVKDDFGLILNSEGNKGFFSSTRKGGAGEDDIYSFEAPDGLLNLSTVVTSDVTIQVVNAKNGSAIEGAKVRVLEQAEDGFLEGDDVYDVEMIPNPSNPDELVFKLKRKNASEFDSGTKTTYKDGETLVEMKSGKKYIILASKIGFENTEQMHFARLNAGENKITVSLEEIACVSILGEVSADNFKSGIADAELVITNECTGATETFKSSTGGNFETCLRTGCDYSVQCKKDGYFTAKEPLKIASREMGSTVKLNIRLQAGQDKTEPVMAETTKTTTIKTSDNMLKESVETGDIIELRNIYYDFGKSSIRSGAARDLDALVTMMRTYPSMEIELISHTDSRGSTKFNQNLSLKRAESAKNYLVGRGIVPNRISAFGYGENEPRNHCIDGVECSDEEYEYNRRTEVRITRIDKTVKVNYQSNSPVRSNKID